MRRKDKEKKEKFQGVILISGVLAFVIIVGILIIKNYEPTRDTDKQGCFKDTGPNKYFEIIVDNTEILNSVQERNIIKRIYKILEDADPNDKVSIYSLDDSSLKNNFKPLIGRCSLKDGSNYNMWMENKNILYKRWAELFDEPIKKAVEDMMDKNKSSKESLHPSPYPWLARISMTRFRTRSKTFSTSLVRGEGKVRKLSGLSHPL